MESALSAPSSYLARKRRSNSSASISFGTQGPAHDPPGLGQSRQPGARPHQSDQRTVRSRRKQHPVALGKAEGQGVQSAPELWPSFESAPSVSPSSSKASSSSGSFVLPPENDCTSCRRRR